MSKRKQKPQLDSGLSIREARPIVIHICKDGTISYRDRTKNEPVFNGVALPVFSVDTVEQAKQLQIRFGRLQYINHPVNNMTWYKLSVLPDGTDPVTSRKDGLLKLEDLEGITTMFANWYRDFVQGTSVKEILFATWQGVGSDALSACREAGETLDEDTAIELILDAHRAETYVRTPAQALALADFRLLPYDQQVKVAKQLVGGRLV